MLSRRLGLMLVLATALEAHADDSDTDLARATQALRSDSVSDRDRGSAILDGFATSDPTRLWPLLRDPDAEVSSRVFDLLRQHGALPPDDAAAAARRLLDALSEVAADQVDDRAFLVDQLLSLGEPAALLLQAELDNRKLEPIATDMRVVDSAANVIYRATVRNGGAVGLWLPAEIESAKVHELRARLRVAGIPQREHALSLVMAHGIGATTPSFAAESPPLAVPDDRIPLRDWLISSRRLKPGESSTWAEGSFDLATRPPACGILELGASVDKLPAPGNSIVGGREVSWAGDCFPAGASSRFLVLQEIAAQEFSGEIRLNGRVAALVVTALQPVRPVRSHARQDRFWFAALDDCGRLLAFGPMRLNPSPEMTWKSGEKREIPLESPVPPGTCQLWLGYDWGISWGSSGQLVPAPAKLDPGPRLRASNSD